MVILALVTLIFSASQSAEGLTVGFYTSVCPGKDVEGTIRSAVQAKFNKDKTITPGLLRMFFHDCFVQVTYMLPDLSENSCTGSSIFFSALTHCNHAVIGEIFGHNQLRS